MEMPPYQVGLESARLKRRRYYHDQSSILSVKSRIYGNGLSESALTAIITDVVDEQYSDVRISSFITACAACPLDHGEVLALTRAMVDAGERLSWNADIVLD